MNTGLPEHLTKRAKIVLLAFVLAILLGVGLPAVDAALGTGFVPAVLADGPQRDGGG
jgi:hypothetical protein